MLAEKDNYIKEASKTIFELSSDEMIQKQCRDREEYYLDKRAMERIMEEQKVQLAEKDDQLAKASNQLAEKDDQLAKASTQLAEKNNQLAAQASEIAALKAQLAELKK